MNASITIAKQGCFDLDALAQMHRLRARVFSQRMGWDVAILSGMEIDDYDAQSPYYLLVRDEYGIVSGCWRLLPTQGRYMLRNTFAALLHEHDAPASPRIWELSRFAIVSPERTGYGFGELALDAMRAVVRFADRLGITNYVTVTTTAVERLLARTGIDMRRFGPALRIGNANAVALNIDLGEQTHEALFGRAPASRSTRTRFEQSFRTADERAARLVKTQGFMHFTRKADPLGHCNAGEGSVTVAQAPYP